MPTTKSGTRCLLSFSFFLFPFLVLGCAWDQQQSDNSIKTHETDRDKQMASAKPGPAPRINPQTHLAAGQMLEKQGDLKGALDQYEKAVVASPKLATGYNRLGIVYEKMGRFREAERVFRNGIDAAPGSASLRNNLGYCYLVQRKFDDAQEQFTGALAVSPRFKRARMNLGIVFAQTGRLQKGLNEFKRVVSEDAANYNLAVICLAAGDYSNAEKSLKRALAVNPKLSGAQQKLDQIQAWAKATHTGEPAAATPQGRIERAAAKKRQAPEPLELPLAGTADDESVIEPR